MDALKALVGLTVEKVEQVHDYLQLSFQEGTKLSVYNSYSFENGDDNVECDRVHSVGMDSGDFIIRFSGGGALHVGLRDQDYNGPEAMSLVLEGKKIVWN